MAPNRIVVEETEFKEKAIERSNRRDRPYSIEIQADPNMQKLDLASTRVRRPIYLTSRTTKTDQSHVRGNTTGPLPHK